LRSAQEHAEYVAGIRQVAEDAGVHVVINARTDLFKNAADPLPLLDEGLARLQALVDAGADALYPVQVQSSDRAVRTITAAMPLPVNITARPNHDELARMRELGVGRISFGPLLQKALQDSAVQMLGRWH